MKYSKERAVLLFSGKISKVKISAIKLAGFQNGNGLNLFPVVARTIRYLSWKVLFNSAF